MMSMSDQIAIDGSDSQSTAQPSSPILPSRSLTAPLVCSSRLQPVPTMTSEITYGTKISRRVARLRRVARVSSRSAATSATTICTGTMTSTNRSTRHRPSRNTGSVNALT